MANASAIDDWLAKFKQNWKAQDIDGVMDLFADNVEYWETPHLKLRDKNHIRQEWQGVLEQENIELETQVYSSTPEGKNTVLWQLSYEKGGEIYDSAGTYLITLNSENLCTYFHYSHVDK